MNTTDVTDSNWLRVFAHVYCEQNGPGPEVYRQAELLRHCADKMDFYQACSNISLLLNIVLGLGGICLLGARFF